MKKSRKPTPIGIEFVVVLSRMFWLNLPPRMDRVPKDTYWSSGFMGQVTMVIPSRDMVVVRMGPSPGGVYPYLNEAIGRILEALPEN